MIGCACGCGTQLDPLDSRGRPRRYAHGHNGRSPTGDADAWRFIDKGGPCMVRRLGRCWLWTGGASAGYGRFRGRQAHRVVYELVVGPIAHGMELDHLCRNPTCVRPSHLEPVTHAENLRRGLHRNQHFGQTHCKRGHAFTPENTHVTRAGARQCRQCHREYMREWKGRRAA